MASESPKLQLIHQQNRQLFLVVRLAFGLFIDSERFHRADFITIAGVQLFLALKTLFIDRSYCPAVVEPYSAGQHDLTPALCAHRNC